MTEIKFFSRTLAATLLAFAVNLAPSQSRLASQAQAAPCSSLSQCQADPQLAGDRKVEPVRSEKFTERKNVLLIVADDLRADVLGCYGHQVCKTPNLDRLARRGMVFTRAYCQATWCAPSRQSFMHGRYQPKSGQVNLGQHLISQGFYSARVGKIYHMRVPGDIIAGTNGNDLANSWTERFNSPGLEAHTPGQYACLNLNIFTRSLSGRQSTRMPHRPFVTVIADEDGRSQPDFKSASKAIEILRARSRERLSKEPLKPFFLAVGLVRPHYPMVAPEVDFARYRLDQIALAKFVENDLDDIPKAGRASSTSQKVGLDAFPENQKRMWQGYFASVSFMDRQVGRILEALDRLGLRESTTIVFSSDHGYHLGEHHFWQKSNLHESVTRVPLIIDHPGAVPGRTESLVELVDLFPTICEITESPVPANLQGDSLLPILKDPGHSVREAAVSLHRGIGIRTAEMAYMRYRDGSEELYDMESDPDQFSNLAGKQEASEHQKRLRAIADAKMKMYNLRLEK